MSIHYLIKIHWEAQNEDGTIVGASREVATSIDTISGAKERARHEALGEWVKHLPGLNLRIYKYELSMNNGKLVRDIIGGYYHYAPNDEGKWRWKNLTNETTKKRVIV